MDSSDSQLPDLHNGQQPPHHLDRSSANDDFLDQMLSSWPDIPQVSTKFPWDNDKDHSPDDPYHPHGDQSTLLAWKLRQHQIGPKPMVLQLNQQQQQLMVPSMARTGETGLVPLSPGTDDSGIPMEGSREAGDGLGQRGAAIGNNQPRFPVPQNYGGPSPASTGATSGGGAPPRQKVRARRGQATDPHSIAERLRRERIAERMKALQELVPNANKTDKASMLDEIIDYVKFLQLQVKVLSMSRLGGAAAIAPFRAIMSSERVTGGGAKDGTLQGSATASGGNDGVTMTEQRVAKLMEEDMGSAMQYLQGKGLCLMPISLASAISTTTSTHSRSSVTARYHLGDTGNHLLATNNGEGPPEGALARTKEGSSTSKSDP